MELFNKLKEPIFLKETSSAKEQLEQLEKLLEQAGEESRKQIEKDIKLITYGLKGEEQIAFELKNSHIPMYILHDLYFEEDGLNAQIDYLIVTQKCTFVLECKNLWGDITINDQGDFIRSMTFAGKTIKEGIYSPVTQNRRHMELIKAMRIKEKKNFLTRGLLERNFYDNYQSVVVLANPKTVLKARYAPKAVKEQVIRADQLIEYIKKVNGAANRAVSSDVDMKNLANYFLSKHQEKRIDYTSHYQMNLKTYNEQQEVAQEEEMKKNGLKENREQENQEILIKKLKAYRLEQSRKEQIKPYFIFNDKQMMELIEKRPRSLEELLKLSGFGEVKCSKYGESLIRILEE